MNFLLDKEFLFCREEENRVFGNAKLQLENPGTCSHVDGIKKINEFYINPFWHFPYGY